jgi:hypothetical protein
MCRADFRILSLYCLKKYEAKVSNGPLLRGVFRHPGNIIQAAQSPIIDPEVLRRNQGVVSLLSTNSIIVFLLFQAKVGKCFQII